MNTFERRQVARTQIVDVSIAKTGISKSRRQRAEAARKLRKAMAASYLASTIKTETISYPPHARG